MGADDRTRARAALDAVGDKHRAFSAAVGAAAAWATAVASRTRQEADDVAWRRAAAELDDVASAGAWDNVLRDYQPLVVWPEYGQRLTELHDDLGTALLGPAAYKSIAGLAPANSLRTVKHAIESAWREDRAAGIFDGYLTEAQLIYQGMWQSHHEWVDEVNCAADLLDRSGFTSLWMRSTYVTSVIDRADRAAQVFRDVYAALARAEFEPLVLVEWNSRDIPMAKAALEARGMRNQDDVRRAFTSNAAFIIDQWIGALLAGSLPEVDRDVTIRALEEQFPEAMTIWRRMCASRVANGEPALRVPAGFYNRRTGRRAS
jgi:hypothetical protein